MVGIAAIFAALACAPLRAEPLPQPQHPIILTVAGDIARTNSDAGALFDLDMLRDLETVTYRTTTIWSDGPQVFTGVSIADIAARVGTDADTLTATALNDYTVDIPAEDWGDGQAIVAYLHNGEPMSVREMGPLWIVYPYDTSPHMRTESIYARSVWQLARLEFVE